MESENTEQQQLIPQESPITSSGLSQETSEVTEEPTKEEQPEIILQPKHEEFVHNFITMKNATKAYLATYPDCSYNVARSSASRLLTNANILARYKQLIDPIRKALRETLTSHLYELATFNAADLLDDDGNIDMAILKEKCIPGLVSGISIRDENRTNKNSETIVKNTSIRLANQEKAVELLAKIEDVLKEKVELSGEHVQIIVGKPRLKDGETLDS